MENTVRKIANARTIYGWFAINSEYFPMNFLIIKAPSQNMFFFFGCKFFKFPSCALYLIFFFQQYEHRVDKKCSKETECYAEGKSLSEVLYHGYGGERKHSKSHDGC